MEAQKKNCKNCKKDFIIESEDFNFYEKIKVPPPTFCPWCRFIRRMAWRNERSLYKRTCDLCKKNIIAMYPEDVPFPVYCRECWYGDGWDSVTYGRDYDFSKSFFEQLKELFCSVPHIALWQRNSINSDYSNWVAESRNVYLSASVVENSENVFYSKSVDGSKDIIDSYNLKKSEQCYQNVDCEKNYNSQFLYLSRNCIDSYFLIDSANCSNCFMSSNLRNKQYIFRNKQYSREAYLEELEKLNLGSRSSQSGLTTEFDNLKKNAIFRYANNLKCVDSFGNNLFNNKNCQLCFDIYDSENSKYCYRTLEMKDSMDFNFGGWSELIYEYISGMNSSSSVKFSSSCMTDLRDVEYSHSLLSSANIFGCFGMKNKKYFILNKQYSKEDFIVMREKIIKHMDEMPYIDKKGRIYKYGEFFPIELSPHAYNETLAQEFLPITKEEATKFGYDWRDQEEKNLAITLSADKIPDDIKNVDEKILEEVLRCIHESKCEHQCSSQYRITQGELQFYKKHNIPLPDWCPNCRYYERFAQVPKPILYHRKCMCDKENHNHALKCEIEFETPYAPERTEKIFCESCYNKEVY
jgi:hypothetical protein